MNIKSNNAWECLGVSPGTDQAEIRKAYAELVRQYRPDSHPEEFAAIRSAYEEALHISRSQAAAPGQEWELAASVPDQAQRLEAPDAAERIDPYDWNQHAEREMLRQAMESNDVSVLTAWLKESFIKARNGTFDAMQDFEALVVNMLLNHSAPPPAFVEACAHQLDWSNRWLIMATDIGHDNSMRLRGLLHLAVQYRFSAHSSANKWQRYLFANASTRIPAIGWTPLLVRANKVAQEWRQSCGELGFSGYLAYLNPRVTPHVNGDTVQSCDIKNALLVAIYGLFIAYKAPAERLPIWAMALIGAFIFVAMSGFRPLFRRARKTFELGQLLAGLRTSGLVVAVLAFICGMASHELSKILWLEEPLHIFEGICFAYLLTVVLWLHWWMVRTYDTEFHVFSLRKMDWSDGIWWERENGESDESNALSPG